MTPRTRRGGPSRWLLLLLLVAITFGACAALLAGPAAPFSPTAPGTNFQIPFTTFVFLFGIVVVAFPLVWIGSLLLARYRGLSTPIPSRAVVMFLVVFLIAVGFVVLFRFGPGSGAPPVNSTVPPGTNGTGGTEPSAHGGTNNTTTGPPFGSLSFGGVHLPGWLLYVGLVAAAVVAVAVVAPVVAGLRTPVPPSPDDAAAAEARREFARALEALEGDASQDPRTVIVALYANLLRRLTPTLDRLELRTPREIERLCVERLRIRPETAHALTALFEEARYSRHVLPVGGAVEARRVFAQAVRDLDRSGGPG